MAFITLRQPVLAVCISDASWSAQQSWTAVLQHRLQGWNFGPINQESQLAALGSGSFCRACVGQGSAGLSCTALSFILGKAVAALGCFTSYHHADTAAHLHCIPGNLWHQCDFLCPLLEYDFEQSVCDSAVRMLITWHNHRVKLLSAITKGLLNICAPGQLL